MARKQTRKPVSKARPVRNLPLSKKHVADVKGGKASVSLLKTCATGEHIKEATITV